MSSKIEEKLPDSFDYIHTATFAYYSWCEVGCGCSINDT